MHRVETFTLSTSDRALLNEAATVFEFQPRRSIRLGLYLNDIRRRFDLRDLERLNARVAQEIDRQQLDVILVDVCRFTGAPFVLRYLETPAAYYCHEPPRALHENAWQSHATRYERLRQSWRAPLERQLARRLAAEDTSLVRAASAVLTNSRYTQSRILSIYGVNATVCPPGVHTPEVDDVIPADSTYVLSVGALEPHKAFDFLIDALSLIPAATRPALHVVANDQNAGYRRVLQRKARAAGVELSIRFRIPDTELAREYAGAALFVFAAHDEPLGLSPLEAMSHGLAVLAVGEGGVRETVDDGVTGILTPRSPQYFAQRLYELLDSREYARQLGMRGRQRVQNDWSWQARGACLASHLEQIAQGAGREQVRLTR